MHTRSNRTGERSFACSMRNFGRWFRTAVCNSIGMSTRPNESEPFQIARATSAFCLLPFAFLLRSLEFPLRLEPVLEIHAVAAATLEVALICAHADIVFTRRRAHRGRTVLRLRRLDATRAGVLPGS